MRSKPMPLGTHGFQDRSGTPVQFTIQIGWGFYGVQALRPECLPALTLVHPARLERAAYRFGTYRSIRLSYGCLK